MRILFIANDFPSPLEPAKAVFNLQLAQGLAKKHDVRVISPIAWLDQYHAGRRGAVLPPGRKSVVDGISVRYPNYLYPPGILRNHYGWFFWRCVRPEIQSLLAHWRPELVLAYWVHPDGHAALKAAEMCGAKSAVIVGGSDVQIITKNSARKKRVQEVLQSIDSVITVNRDLKSKVVAMGIGENKVHPWSQGVDERVFFVGEQAEARQKLGIELGVPNLLWVGRFVQVKGVEIMIQAAEILHKRGIDFRLHLVGEGPLRSQLEIDAWQRDLRKQIIFHGSRKPAELGDFYRAADLFLMSSWSEGLPNVLRESLACGTPFVSSNVGGIAEISGDFNRLFPAGDAKAMADQIAAMLSNLKRIPEARRPISWEQSADDLVKIMSCAPTRPIMEQPAGHSPRQLIRRVMTGMLPRKMLLNSAGRPDAVCLTFDDGPHPDFTPMILDALGRENAKATFFVLGSEAEKYPELIRRIAREGHAIGHHTYSHGRNLPSHELLDEIHRTEDCIRRAGATPANLFRPPYGKLSASRFVSLWRKGTTVVLWSRDPKDFSGKSVDDLRKWIAEKPLCGGDVVLMHDVVAATANVLPELIAKTKSAGLKFITIDPLFQKLQAPAQSAHLAHEI